MGLVKVRLYRPFSAEHFLAALPATVKTHRRARPHQGAGRARRAALRRCLHRLHREGRHRAEARGRPLRPGVQGFHPGHGQGRLRQPEGRSAQEPLHRRHRRRRDPHLAARSAQTSTRRPRARCGASSGAWAPTARWARTRTPSRSSATTRTCTRRPTSPTTPRSPAASPISHLRFGQTADPVHLPDRRGRLHRLPQPGLRRPVRHARGHQGGRHLPAQLPVDGARRWRSKLPGRDEADDRRRRSSSSTTSTPSRSPPRSAWAGAST